MSIYGTNEAKNGDSFDSKSTISNVDKIEILFQNSISGIESFAAGYDASGFKATVDSFSNTIKSVQLLSGYNSTVNKEEDCGRRLFEDLDRVIKTFGREFGQLIAVNFNIEMFRADCISRRTDLDTRVRKAKVLSSMLLIEPRKDRIEFKHGLTLKERKEELFASDSYQELSAEMRKKALTRLKKEIEQESLLEYFIALDEYEKQIKDKNEATAQLHSLQLEFDRATMIERVCNLFMDSNLQLINKVKDTVVNFTSIQSVLKGTVIIRETKEQLCNPLENNNLSGVMEILYDRYQKKTFVSFTLNLMDAIGWSLSDDDSINNPAKGVNEVQQLVSKWRSRDMGKELTDDQLFTAILIKGLSPKANFLRQTLLSETHKFIMNLIEDQKKNDVDLPIFNFVCQHILTHQGTLQYATKMKLAAKVTFDNNTKGTTSAYNNNNNFNKRKELIESAAQGVETANSAGDMNGKLYAGEILRERNIKYTHRKTNREHPYVAVTKLSSICSKCYPDQGEGIPCGRDGENKKCYAVLCGKCGMYGHPQAGCMQATAKKN